MRLALHLQRCKFTLGGISEALAAELSPLGIHLTLAEPGPFFPFGFGYWVNHTEGSFFHVTELVSRLHIL